MTATPVTIARGLEGDLRRSVEGEVRFDPGARALYAVDASNYRQVPIGVVVPRTVDDVVATVEACRRHGAPLLSRGGGTSLAGQCCNVAVVIDWSKHLDRVLDVDPERRVARVQPGVVLDDLRRAVGRHGLTFGPDPATHDHCTLGGMIGNDSCGVHSVMAGRTADNVERLEVLTYGGERMWVGATDEGEIDAIVARGGQRGTIYGALRALRDELADEVRARYPDIPRRVSGYNLDELLPEKGFHVARALVGTESTCVTVLEADVRLVPDPPDRSLVVLGYDDVFAAADHVPDVMAAGPVALEGLDSQLFELTRHKHLHPRAVGMVPGGQAFLLVEFGGDGDGEAVEAARRFVEAGAAGAVDHTLYAESEDQELIWAIRESGLGATAKVPHEPDTWPGWEDSAVPPERLGDYLRQLRRLLDRRGYGGALYGHFGQGCVHTRIDFDLRTARGVERYHGFAREAAELVASFGGSLSGEHGDGQSRAELLPIMFGDRLVDGFRRFKAIWDPDGRMNPGKVVDPAPMTASLRFDSAFDAARPRTWFSYGADDGSFERATERCVGVGRCRKTDAGTMCPSYMATRDERHSTRGRAHLLNEMLRGEVVTDGWRSDAVDEALDLCLACKACSKECPVSVDMATYKAEFLAQRHRRRLRPRAHYSMGWLPIVARVAARGPRVANTVLHGPTAGIAKRVAGIDAARTMPSFARPTLERRLRAAGLPRKGERGTAVLWPDTFTNHFDPGIGEAAVAVLAAAGWRVELPAAPVCCGLTWVSTGQLATASRVMRRTLSVLGPHLRAGHPIVGLEPSCTAALRGDLVELVPGDDGERLAGQVVTLAELLLGRRSDGWVGDATPWEPPPVRADALVQRHCHHEAVLGFDADRELLDAAGVDADVLDSGCCGLAGNFGFEAGHHEVSLAVGERVLLPAVRAADPATTILADGFSCRTQVAEATGRRARHLAELLAAGLPPAGGADAEAPC